MLTLGQASCLVLGYKPTNENRKIAKKYLQETGLIAFHFRGQDHMRPAEIGLDVHERDPYTFLIYPSTLILSPTETSLDDIIEDGDGTTHNSDDDCNNVESNKDAANKTNDNDKAPRGQKRKFDSPVIPYCKDRVLHIMKTIGTNVDPTNESVFSHEFVTSALQYKIMTDIFPNLHRHCKETQLQYWVGQAKI
ncbi:hypothetical protein CLU79DRAFT_831566 [Phycomyces nitens]|nr:hypothetical protein CLU79DRAFT_831566 [Phycomyces nitens]